MIFHSGEPEQKDAYKDILLKLERIKHWMTPDEKVSFFVVGFWRPDGFGYSQSGWVESLKETPLVGWKILGWYDLPG